MPTKSCQLKPLTSADSITLVLENWRVILRIARFATDLRGSDPEFGTALLGDSAETTDLADHPCLPGMSMMAAIRIISPSSMSVTVDMGKLNTVPKHAQRIVRLASKLWATPKALTDITIRVATFVATGWMPVKYAAPRINSIKG